MLIYVFVIIHTNNIIFLNSSTYDFKYYNAVFGVLIQLQNIVINFLDKLMGLE